MTDQAGEHVFLYPNVLLNAANFIMVNITPFYESSNRTKDHPVATYHCQHTDHWLYLWTSESISKCGNRNQMGVVSSDCVIRALVVERPLGEKKDKENAVRTKEEQYIKKAGILSILKWKR